MTTIKEFNNLDYLQAVRNDHLNPLIRRVENEIAPVLAKLEHEVTESVKNVTLTESTKTLRFDKGDGGYKDIDLTPIMPKFSGIGVKDIQDQGPSAGINLLRFPDATVTTNTPGDNVSIGFDWKSIFEHNQKWTEAVVSGTPSHLKSIIFTGDPDAVKRVGENVTLKVPKMEPLLVTIPDGSPSIKVPTAVKEIELTGETGGCVIDAQGKMTLNLNAGGGGGITNQNFKGFYESLGDIQSFVKDPIDGKSFAFAKDTLLQGKYYTPYFYVNGGWQELKQDPALTYSGITDPVTHGVFSIKPSDKIKVDANGQIDLDGLSTPQIPRYFEGFFDTLDEMKATVKNPVTKQSFAFVKSGGRGWITYRFDGLGLDGWSIVAPLGSFTFVDDATQSFTQVFGIKKSDSWEVDSRGILNMKGGGGPGPGGALSVSISDYNNQAETHDVTAISFNKGKGFAEFTGSNKDHVLLDHPQRVVNYNATFEAGHNTRDYEGNIFYDETSRTWMGWGIPDAIGAVDTKWTRIAHPHMSDEVKGLNKRLPAKAESIQPGIIGDNRAWDYNGITFLDKDNQHLPEEIKAICGGYITTSVQNKDVAGVTIPQYRLQTLTADREEGGTWVRRYISTGTPGSQASWSPWVRTSFSEKDIDKHAKDPNAHKEVLRFYRVLSLKGNVWALQNQEFEGVKGAIRQGNKDLLADNYGITDTSQDFGSIPYDNGFNGNGVIEFSGYNGTATALGKWTIKARILRKGTSVPVDIYEGYYVHTKEQERFPALKFEIPQYNASLGDQVVLHILFDNPTGLHNKQPDLYICPIKSYAVLQDSQTVAGTLIGDSFRNLLGRVDFFGDVGVRVHHNNNDVKKNVRVYGVVANKAPTDLIPKP